MDFRITSTSKTNRKRWGFTLIELLIASGISSMLFMVVSSMSFFAARSFAAMTNYVDLDAHSRDALDRMTKQIREVNQLTASTETSLTFEDDDGGTLEFIYDAANRKLIRRKNGIQDAKPLLEQCDYLKFGIFQRNPLGGTYDQYPTATPATCKVVQMTWICSRTILGAKVNTESVLSAKVVIRKQ